MRYISDDYIFGFDISMEDMQVVKVLNSLAQLSNDVYGGALVEAFLLPHERIKLTFRS